MNKLKDKVALVTGSAVRVGRIISLGLSCKKLVLHYHKSKKEALSLKDELEMKGIQCDLFQADLKEPQQIEKLFEFIKNKHEHLDILINNAASYEKKPFLEVEDFDSSLDLNLKAPLICSQYAARLMPTGSLILNICDMSSKNPLKHRPLHSISKAALMYATKVLAWELAPNVRVNNLLLGMVLPSDECKEKALDNFVERHVLLKRACSPQEIVKAIHTFIENEYLNSTTIELTGGWL